MEFPRNYKKIQREFDSLGYGEHNSGWRTMKRRLTVITILIVIIIGTGIAGFWTLGRAAGAQPTVLDCAYQTVITLATVGNMTPKLAEVWYGQVFIIVLILSGMGVLLVFATTVTAFLVEGEMHQIFRRKKMDKALQNMKDHIIVCGAGSTGANVIEELLHAPHPMVIVDLHEERIQRLVAQHPKTFIPYVVGQAADDDILAKAGLKRAKGVVVTLPDDRDNLFITVTARQTNPDLKLVVRSSGVASEKRLKRAGADSVVTPSRIGGMRMASEIARPQVVSFLDNMLRGPEQPLRIEEIPLGESCSMVDKALRDTDLRSQDLLVLAIRDKSGEHFIYNPSPDLLLEKGSTLIVLGPMESVQKFRSKA
jgi:voltage-gated potassium channel